jgi:hypothetical protein
VSFAASTSIASTTGAGHGPFPGEEPLGSQRRVHRLQRLACPFGNTLSDANTVFGIVAGAL